MSEGRAWLERALEHGSNAAPSTRAKALYGAGRLQPDWERMSALIEQALALWRELGDKSGMADALLNLGRGAYEQGDYERAGRLVKESLVLFQDQQITWGIVWALLSLGDVAMVQGDCIQVLEAAQQVLTLTNNLGDTYGNMWARCLLGRLAYFQGDLERAKVLFEESLAWFRNLGNVGVIDVLIYLGRVVLDQGDTARAATLFRESLEAQQELGNKLCIARSLAGLAGVAGGTWQPRRAAQLLGAVERIHESIGQSLTPIDRNVFDRYAAAIRAQLDDATFAAAWAAGRALTLDEAIAEALRVAPIDDGAALDAKESSL
jgi:tetratricopeptide (TPR) repeat protein